MSSTRTQSEASFHMSQGIYNAEARIQFEALILMLAITGHRPSHFLVWAGSGGLLIDDLVVRQVAPAEYAIEGEFPCGTVGLCGQSAC